MSRRRHHSRPDSLELLLDTMCNTFGGIILIALLIALISREASSDSTQQQRQETLQQRIQQAQKQLTDAEQLRDRLQKDNADPEVAAKIDLLRKRDEIRLENELNKVVIQSNQTANASVEVSFDPKAVETLQAELETQTNQIRVVTDQLLREGQLRQRQVRLPRERATGKKTAYYILRFGKIYPVHILNEGRRELNSQTLAWRRTPEGEVVTPRRDLGLDALSGLPAFARLLSEVPQQAYAVHFLVYNDSFPAFLSARQIPLGRGYDVGWEFLTEDRPLVFSSEGQAPPAL